MSEEVLFSEPIEVPEALAPYLPYNYLPAAFSAISGEAEVKSRLLFVLPVPEVIGEKMSPRIAPRYTLIDAKTLADPLLTVEHISKIEGMPNPVGDAKIFLGPEVAAEDAQEGPLINTFTFIDTPPLNSLNAEGFDKAVVIIDAGIAFWNRRFRGPGGSRFREMRFLDFERPDLGLGPANLLGPGQISDYCKLADDEGPTEVMRALSAAFPNSFYGKAGGADVDGLWHGTAVADLAAGADPGSAGALDRIALYGIELPAALLHTHDGDALTGVLAILVDYVLEITRSIGGKELVVALPFGFTGGPQDGMHPAAKTIDDLLKAHPSRAGKVTFLVPAGNHLQDRCRARLPEAQAGVPVLSVDWHIAPDDFSSNQIEILIDNVAPADGRASLRIAPPGPAAEQTIGLKAGHYQFITVNGARVGLLMRYANTAMPPPQLDLRARLRLCLWPTGYRPGGIVPAPHGRWRLSTHSVQPVDLWVLRDDRDRILDEAFPRRASWLDDPLYQDTDWKNAPGLSDDPGSLVLRSGTLSVLATAPSAVAVQADEQLGVGPRTKAFYSGSPDTPAAALTALLGTSAKLVDDGKVLMGKEAAANGTERRVQFSGTSAAVGMAANAAALAP